MANDKEIVIERVFDAPREKVWQAWTDPKLVEKWFGPEGFTTRVEKSELKVGGKLRYVMVGPDGKDYPSEGTILELIEMEKLAVTDEFGDDLEMEGVDLPQGMEQHITFEDAGPSTPLGASKTKVTIRITHPTVEDKQKHEEMGVVAGYNSSLDKLAKLLEA